MSTMVMIMITIAHARTGWSASGTSNSLEGRVHPAAVAAGVSVGAGAVDQLLLAQRDQRVAGQRPGALQRAGGRERPARAALALVLDAGDHAGVAPVHLGRVHVARHLIIVQCQGAALSQQQG